MRKGRDFVYWLVCGSLFVGFGLMAAPRVTTVDVELRRLDITQYEITATDDLVEVEFATESSTRAGLARFDFSSSETVAIEWRPAGAEPFDVLWNARTGEFVLILESGERFVRKFDFETRQWIPSELAELAIEQRSAPVAAVGRLLSKAGHFNAVRLQQRPVEHRPISTCMYDCGSTGGSGGGAFDLDPDGDGDPYELPATLRCSTTWIEGTAYALAYLTRPEICYKAKNDANVKCSNRLCIGCCELMECAAHCLQGEFFCSVASVNGRYCTR
jgi:hypothetical protein